jgi:catechol 2,3-dioxygenase-like lactoylglutathione lyase family enzyme
VVRQLNQPLGHKSGVVMAEPQPQQTDSGLGSATPIFAVSDLEKSIDYYVKVLGFTIDWTDAGPMASVSRGECCIFLSQGDQGHVGTWTWIGVEDIEPLFAEYGASGARIRHPPTNYWWAYEMQIEDLDGNVLRIGSDTKAGEPFGPWLDMRGDRWIRSEDGDWTRVSE